MSMKEDLELLLKLQVLDYDRGELERSKEYIPDMMENLRREISENEENYRNNEKELTEATATQKNLELEISSLQDNLKKLKSQMMAIKTNKEYDALVSQIDAIKESINEKETDLLETIERVEILESSIDEFRKKSIEIKKLNDDQLSILQEKMDSVGTKIQMKDDERQNITVRVPKRILSIYERIRKSRGGSVVVAVKKRACGACFKALPPHRIQELKRGDQLISCDNCGRLLIWQNGNSE
ncbi:MAG TPA: hypothetical protein ENL22_04425 [candidate division Zixibacteria bacterium]|nr:hypothetical protein [candidate division Zixibacteria bacterium]